MYLGWKASFSRFVLETTTVCRNNAACTFVTPPPPRIRRAVGLTHFAFYVVCLRVDLNEGCFLGLFQYFHEISVFFVGFFLYYIGKYRKFGKTLKKAEKHSSLRMTLTSYVS